MHGVKRLFAWMIPRFDPARFNVSLVSLRKKDLSEETLESFGVDISYLHKSKFDPATLTALLKIIDRKPIDILHLHGYGATTFGRAAAAMRRLPTILHEHANLTDTPWFQKVADRALEPFTDIAIAVSKSTADFVINARHVPAQEGEGGVPRRAARRVQPRSAAGARSTRPGGRSASGPTISPSAPSRACTTPRATSTSSTPPASCSTSAPDARFFVVGEGPLRPDLEAQAAAPRRWATASSSPGSRRTSPRPCRRST